MLKVNNLDLQGAPEHTACISFEIKPGEVLVLGGPSGHGKSTLAKRIAGVSTPTSETSGTIDTGRKRPFMVLQNYEEVLSPVTRIGKACHRLLTMDDRIISGYAWDQFRADSINLGLPSELLRKTPGQVSGGQMQRFLIALGLATGAGLVIYDETLSGLDYASKQKACDLIEKRSMDSGKSILIIGHDEDLHKRFNTIFTGSTRQSA